MHFSLSEDSLVKIIVQLCRFFIEFSQFWPSQDLCFLHPKVFNCVTQTAIKNLSLYLEDRIALKCLGKEKDLLSKIGILGEFQKHSLFGSNLFLFKSPKKHFRSQELDNVHQQPIEYAFEVPVEPTREHFRDKIKKLRKKQLKMLSHDQSDSLIADGLSRPQPRQLHPLEGLEDLDFLAQDPHNYFYKRWLWIIFPWACLYANNSKNFSETICQFNFGDIDYLTGETAFWGWPRGKRDGRES